MFSVLLFLYFLTLSGDLLNVRFFLFTGKLTQLLSVFTLLFYGVLRRGRFALDREFLQIAALCLFSLTLSATFGYNKMACLGFIAFFLFNYLFYFAFSSQLFSSMDVELLLKLYWASFICVGCYAAAQVLFSFCGVLLPFAGQVTLDGIARGQGWSYEPSYYALYMTPYAIFQTTQYLLQEPQDRSLKQVILANSLLLFSTSTGCFFTYLAFIFTLWLFKLPIARMSIYIISSSLGIFLIYPSLVRELFFKFFFLGWGHHSFLERWVMIVGYWGAFLENFWIGTGLGGATTFFLSNKGESPVDTLDPGILRDQGFAATNVTTELLASLGIVGAICFSLLLWIIWKKFRRAYQIPSLEPQDRIRLTSFAVSLCVTFFTLQFNQSIMRCYLWVHLGVCMGYIRYLHAKSKASSTRSGEMSLMQEQPTQLLSNPK